MKKPSRKTRRQQGKTHCRGQGQKHDQSQAPVNQLRNAFWVVQVVGLGQAGKQDGAKSNAKKGCGKFHQSIGKAKPRDTAFGKPRGNVGVDDQAHLSHRNGKACRKHKGQNATYPFVAPCVGKAFEGAPEHGGDLGKQPASGQGPGLQPKLGQPPQNHGNGQCPDGLMKIGGKEKGAADEREVEQHRRERWNLELRPGVQNAGGKGHHGNKNDVRKHKLGEGHGQLKPLLVAREASRH